MHTDSESRERKAMERRNLKRMSCIITWGIMISIIMAGCSGKDEKGEIIRPVVSDVTVMSVIPTEVDESFEAAGTVKSDLTSIIASRVMGTVTSLKVREGDRVESGQLLMTIDDREATERAKAASMAVEAAKQSRDLAKKTWRRHRNLFEQKALSHQEMDQFNAQYQVARAEYSKAKAMADEAATYLDFTRITAPVSGRVTGKKIDVGSMAAPGAPLLTIEGDSKMYVETAVDESLTSLIRTGMPAHITVDSLGKSIPGSVREIVPAVDPHSRTFTVKVSLEDEDLRSGFFTRVRIPLRKRSTILVPDSAVVTRGQLTGVYVVDRQGVITYRLIRTGKHFANGTEVLSGLSGRERIIAGNAERAIDGGIIASGAKQ